MQVCVRDRGERETESKRKRERGEGNVVAGERGHNILPYNIPHREGRGATSFSPTTCCGPRERGEGTVVCHMWHATEMLKAYRLTVHHSL